MNIKPGTQDAHAAQPHRSPAPGERRHGERDAADFERALRKAGEPVEPAGDQEDDSPTHGVLEAPPAPETARPAMPTTLPPRRPQSGPGSDEGRQEIAAIATVTTASRDALPAPGTAAEPARGLLPSASMQDALRAACLPASDTKASSLRIELTDSRAPLHHIALQRSAAGALDVQVGADARLRTPLAASTDRLRARLAERGALLSSVALDAADTPDTTDDTTR